MRFFSLLTCLCAALFLVPTSASASDDVGQLGIQSTSTDIVQSWAQNFQVTGGETPCAFTTDSKGEVYVASYVPYLVANGSYWIIRKLNSLGQLQWTQSFFFSSVPEDIAADANGNVVIVGSQTSGTESSILTIKLFSDGEIDWINVYDGGYGYAAHTDSAGNVYVGGPKASSSGLIMLEYSNDGNSANVASRTDIDVQSMFFMPNGSLVASGNEPSTVNPYMEVLSSGGTFLYSSVTDDTSTDAYSYLLTCDPDSNLYLVVNHTKSNVNSFTMDCYASNGAFNWQTDSFDGLAKQVTAGDTDHAYVNLFNNSAYSNMGFGANGTRFLNASGGSGAIAADGTKGLVTVTSDAAALTYSEINAAAQILWTQTYSLPNEQSQILKVINSTVYSLNIGLLNNMYSTDFVKYVQGIGITSVTAAASSIQGGKTVNVTIELNDPAVAPGLSAYFVSNSSALGLPDVILIPTGKSSITVTALTDPVDVTTTATITGEVNGGARTTSVVLEPAVLSTVAFPGGATASVVGGKTIAGTITLTGKTALLPHAVTLSSNSAKATVPATVNVLAGASTVTFVVTTTAVTASTPVVITAKNGGVTATAKLTITG